MACVTLKRPIDVLGSPHVEQQPLTKRKRCGPLLFPTTPPSTGKKRLKRLLDLDDMPVSPSSEKSISKPPSQFLTVTPPMETDKLVASIQAELKRIQRRKLYTDDRPSNQPGNNQGATPMTPSTSSSAFSLPNMPSTGKDQPLFNLKQVTAVCQRMMKEREQQLREEYDKLLTTKLAEQYDTFVKFSHDQVERRLAESAFSYVS